MPWPETRGDAPSPCAAPLLQRLDQATAVVVGPHGADRNTAILAQELVRQVELPLFWMPMHCVLACGSCQKEHPSGAVVSPTWGNICGSPSCRRRTVPPRSGGLLSERADGAEGADTRICDGTAVCMNTAGGPYCHVRSGDILTGLIGGLLPSRA